MEQEESRLRVEVVRPECPLHPGELMQRHRKRRNGSQMWQCPTKKKEWDKTRPARKARHIAVAGDQRSPEALARRKETAKERSRRQYERKKSLELTP